MRLRMVWVASLAIGCGDNTMMESPDQSVGADLAMGQQPDLAGPAARLKHESRSSAIAIADDDRLVAAVSPDDDRLYLIDTGMANKTTFVQLKAGAEPRSVAFAPDGSFWVANR